MKLRNLPKSFTWLLLLIFSQVSAADESNGISVITLIHPHAKDVESFFQARQIRLGDVSLDERTGLERMDFGWKTTELSISSIKNYTSEVLILKDIKVLATGEDISRLRTLEKDLIALIYSKHPTRDGFWDLAGYVSDRPLEKDAMWYKWEPDFQGYMNLYESGKLRFHEALPDALAGLKHDDLKVRLKAAENLSEMGVDCREAIPEIVDLVNATLEGDVSDVDKTNAIRLAREVDSKMVMMFGDSGMARVVPSLAAVIDSEIKAERSELASSAIRALSQFGDKAIEAVPVLMQSVTSDVPEIVETSVMALVAIAPSNPQVRKVLTPFLDHEDEYIRKWLRARLETDTDGAGS